jgi:glycerate-2-kinase
MALSLPGVSEQPHFERASFRCNKKIFATLDEKSGIAVMMLSLQQQDLFSLHDSEAMHPVPNKWGLKGATEVVLEKVRRQVLKDAIYAAWERCQKKSKGSD